MNRSDAVLQSLIATMLGFIVGGIAFSVLAAGWMWIVGSNPSSNESWPWELNETILGAVAIAFWSILLLAFLYWAVWTTVVLPVTLITHHSRMNEIQMAAIGAILGVAIGSALLYLTRSLAVPLGFLSVALISALVTGGVTGYLLRLKPIGRTRRLSRCRKRALASRESC